MREMRIKRETTAGKNRVRRETARLRGRWAIRNSSGGSPHHSNGSSKEMSENELSFLAAYVSRELGLERWHRMQWLDLRAYNGSPNAKRTENGTGQRPHPSRPIELCSRNVADFNDRSCCFSSASDRDRRVALLHGIFGDLVSGRHDPRWPI